MSIVLCMEPVPSPIGQMLARTSKTVSGAFEDALAEAGGSIPLWLILLSLIEGAPRAQADLAVSLGITGPTLTHHLNMMESDGLLKRARDPKNRRVHIVSLTPKGRTTFLKLRKAAFRFDAKLRRAFSPQEIDIFRDLLHRAAKAASLDAE